MRGACSKHKRIRNSYKNCNCRNAIERPPGRTICSWKDNTKVDCEGSIMDSSEVIKHRPLSIL